MYYRHTFRAHATEMMMRIPKTKMKACWFRGYDGKKYRGHTCGVVNGIVTVVYAIPRGDLCRELVPPEEYKRIMTRRIYS